MSSGGTVNDSWEVVTDSDSGVRSLEYQLVGADAVHFTIEEDTAQLRTETTFDYDNPDDANRDSTYEFMVQTYDGTVVAFREVSVTVTDAPANVQPPTLMGSAAVDHAENGTTVATYSASDPENATIFWLAPEGADARRFEISGGVLGFVDPPDREKPAAGALRGLGTRTGRAAESNAVRAVPSSQSIQASTFTLAATYLWYPFVAAHWTGPSPQVPPAHASTSLSHPKEGCRCP